MERPTLTSTTDSSSSSSSMTHQNQRTVADYLTSKHFDLVINITNEVVGHISCFLVHDPRLSNARRIAIDYSVPLITNVKNVKHFWCNLLSIVIVNCPKVKTTVDCIAKTRLVKMPGLIDVHVHLREPGANHKEDILSGTRAALAGGYTLVCVLCPNTSPSVINRETLELVEDLYERKAVSDYGLFLGATGISLRNLIQRFIID
jgi:carbamoyl-phosphate synthase / aspartate carbamoyltransferase / dihydroorotase